MADVAMSRSNRSNLDLVLDLLLTVGLEVGDYHVDAFSVIDRSGKLFYVKLEGWGPECVPGKDMRAARTESMKLARQWRRSWRETGSIDVFDSGGVFSFRLTADVPAHG